MFRRKGERFEHFRRSPEPAYATVNAEAVGTAKEDSLRPQRSRGSAMRRLQDFSEGFYELLTQSVYSAGVPVVVAHEDLDRTHLSFPPVPEPLGDRDLQGVLERVMLALTADVHFMTHAEEEPDSLQRPGILFLVQESVLEHMIEEELERGNCSVERGKIACVRPAMQPEKRVQVAKPTGALLDVRLQKFARNSRSASAGS